MTLEQMRTTLGISTLPGAFTEIYDRIKTEYIAHAAHILSDEFLTETLQEHRVMLSYQDIILAAARDIRKNEAFSLLVCLLEKWVAQGGDVADSAYEEPIGTGLAYDFLHLFPAIPTIPRSAAQLRSRGVPEDVIVDTLREYDFCIDHCVGRVNRPAFLRDRLNWIRRIIDGDLIHIGRLKYDLPDRFLSGVRVYQNEEGSLSLLADDLQVHSSGRVLGSSGCTDAEGNFLARIHETEDAVTGHPVIDGLVAKQEVVLQKNQWKLCLSENDPVLRVHIPPGGNFDKQTLANTYQRTREVMANCYPDMPFKAFYCSSWLMSLDLREILKPDSNILRFQTDYIAVPIQGIDAPTFSFVFGDLTLTPADAPTLPENTSLQRAIKQRYLDGKHVRHGAGFFF